MDQPEKCSKCGATFAKGDAQVGMRKCVKCKSAVVLQERPGYGPMGGLAGLTGFIFWFFFGLLLGGAIASLIGAVCGLITLFTLKYACSDCSRPVEARLLDTEEKQLFKQRRLGFLVGGIGLGVLSVVLLGARVLLFVHGMNSGTAGP